MTIGDFQEKKIQDNGLPLSLKGKQEVNMGGVYNEIHISCFGTIRKAKGPVFFERVKGPDTESRAAPSIVLISVPVGSKLLCGLKSQ